ncbi:MAG TPA: hypothetical protein VJX67_02555 [Blastocatellia bacterium]|nr:hypothetical protein [Blastocatellia bacterium]
MQRTKLPNYFLRTASTVNKLESIQLVDYIGGSLPVRQTIARF